MSASTRKAPGLDTNVLVRYLVGDDAQQHVRARQVIEEECTPDRPGLVHPVMLCELVWVLRSAYKVPKEEIVGLLDTLLRVRSLQVIDEVLVRQALEAYRTTSADFADALLHVAYQDAGASGFVTFDRKAASMDGVRLLLA